MFDAYNQWKAHKAQAGGGVVIVRSAEGVCASFDDDAKTISTECMGPEYVPQVLDDATEGCEAEFRFRAPHLTKVVRVLMRHLHNVFLYDIEIEEEAKAA